MELLFIDIGNQLITDKKLEEGFIIGEISFTTDGLQILSTSSLLKKREFIKWEQVDTKDYATYFAIYDQKDPANVNRGYSYFHDWNTMVLKNVLQHILKKKAS